MYMIYYISHLYPVMYLGWWLILNYWKEIKYWKSHETYIKCRSWYVNSICTERTTATAVDSSLQLHRPAAERCCTAARPKILPTVSTGDRRVAILVLIWKPSRKDSVIYRRSKPRMAAAWHTATHYQLRVIVPLSSWDHTTCETREPLSPRATAESSSSSSSCCSEERISQCRSDGVVICPCRCPADLTMEIWAATWPMYIYLYGRNHGLSGHGAPYRCPILRTREFQLRTRSGTSHSTRWSIYTSYLEEEGPLTASREPLLPGSSLQFHFGE